MSIYRYWPNFEILHDFELLINLLVSFKISLFCLKSPSTFASAEAFQAFFGLIVQKSKSWPAEKLISMFCMLLAVAFYFGIFFRDVYYIWHESLYNIAEHDQLFAGRHCASRFYSSNRHFLSFLGGSFSNHSIRRRR